MQTGHLWSPTFGKDYSGSAHPLSSSPSNQILLAPSNAATNLLAPLIKQGPYEPSAEETEVLRVGLFIDILTYEFSGHKGYSASDWISLYKYWFKHIAKADHYSAHKYLKQINVRKLIKEGVLTVNTQKRLYGQEAWFPNIIENERDKTIEWLSSLDPEDVQYTLQNYYEGGLKEIRAQIETKKRFRPKEQSFRPKKEHPVIIENDIYLEVVFNLFQELMGYKSKNVSDLAKAAVKFKKNPKLEAAILRAHNIKTALAPAVVSLSPSTNIGLDLYRQYLLYDEEDFEVSLKAYFDRGNDKKLEKRQKTIKNKEISLGLNCFKALYTESKYSDIPAEFENIQNILPQIKSILKFLDLFYQKKKIFYYPADEFLSFCLRNSFPIMPENEKINLVSNSLSKEKFDSENSKNEKFLDTNKSLVPLNETEVRMFINRFSTEKMGFIRTFVIFSEYHGFPATKGKTLFEFWEKIKPADKNKYCLWIFKENREALESKEKEQIRKNSYINILDKYYESLKSLKLEKEKEKTLKKEQFAEKLKKKYKNPKRTSLTESKQGRWALGKKLLEIQKDFPLDPIVKHMVKVEFTENPLKKYDLEYETHDVQDEIKRKQGKVAFESYKPENHAKVSQEDQLKLEYNKLKYKEEHKIRTDEEIKEENTKKQEKPMFKAIKDVAIKYFKFRETQNAAVSLFLSNNYVALKNQFPLAVAKHFPHKNYGSIRKENGQLTFNKSYPLSFKHYFFGVFKSLLKTPKGIVMLKSMPALIWAPSSKSKCTIHIDQCPPNCQYTSLNKKIIRSTMKNEDYYVAWHSKLRPWYRPDMKDVKEKVFMTYSDARECRFEPIVGSKVPEKHLALTFKQFSEIRNKINPEVAPNFNMWVNKLGNNLKSIDSSLFKKGVYKQAKALFVQNKYKETKDLLFEHFNMPCILDHFLPGKPRPTINEKPLEDFNKPENSELLTNVFNLYKSVKDIYSQSKNQYKTLISVEKQEAYSKAKEMCTQELYIEAKILLKKYFNIPLILRHFYPGISHSTKFQQQPEDFSSPYSLKVLKNVCDLYLQYKPLRKQVKINKEITTLGKSDVKSVQIHPVTKGMCHDPKCNKNCGLAHNTGQIRFAQENKIRENYKLKLIEKLKSFAPIKKAAWIPSGRLQDCVNCHSNFLYKPEDKPSKPKIEEKKGKKKMISLADPEIVTWSRSKCCNKCSLEQRLKEKQKKFMEKSREYNETILQKRDQRKLFETQAQAYNDEQAAKDIKVNTL